MGACLEFEVRGHEGGAQQQASRQAEMTEQQLRAYILIYLMEKVRK